MPNFGIFRKSKKEEESKATPTVPTAPVAPGAQAAHSIEEPVTKTYLKALPLRDLADLEAIKNEVNNGNILILRITPLASKSIEDVKRAVNELSEFAGSVGGDIARLGEERVVLTPPKIRIWREKVQVSNEPLSTAA